MCAFRATKHARRELRRRLCGQRESPPARYSPFRRCIAVVADLDTYSRAVAVHLTQASLGPRNTVPRFFAFPTGCWLAPCRMTYPGCSGGTVVVALWGGEQLPSRPPFAHPGLRFTLSFQPDRDAGRRRRPKLHYRGIYHVLGLAVQARGDPSRLAVAVQVLSLGRPKTHIFVLAGGLESFGTVLDWRPLHQRVLR